MSDWELDAWNDAEMRLQDVREDCEHGKKCAASLSYITGKMSCSVCHKDFSDQ